MRDLKERTKTFAINCRKLCTKLPKSREYNALANQLIRCSGSVGANYRASQRAKFTTDFIYKLKIVEEETDESMFWLEMLSEIWNAEETELKRLQTEANELLAITVSSILTAKSRIKK